MAKQVLPIIGGTWNDTKLSWRAYLLLGLLCLCFDLPGLASLPPTDRDESLFAEATKQMIETRDYVDINFLGTPRYKKPVGIYWLQSFSVRALNPRHLDQIWAYRVPSVIGATLAVLMTAALGALLFNAGTGLTAGVMMAACLDLIVEAHIAKTDAALLGAVMVVQFCLARAYLSPQSGWKNAFAFWSAVGVGALIKGPLILLPLFSTLLWLHRTKQDLSWFRRLKPRAGIPYALALVAPWFVAISLASQGQFAAQAAGHDFLAKIWQGQDRGFLPPGLHALLFPAVFFPFSLFSLLALPDAWKNRHERAIAFCVGWIVPTWIVFELSFTKLPHYVLPAYPAIAILTAKFFLDGFPAFLVGVQRHARASRLNGGSRRYAPPSACPEEAHAKRWLPIAAISVWLPVGTGLAIAAAAAPYYIDRVIDPLQIAASGALLVAQGAGLLLFLQRRKIASLAVLVAGMLFFMAPIFSSTLPPLHRLWIARDIVQEARKVAPCPTFKIISAGYQEPSLAFLAGSSTKLAPNGTYAATEMQHDVCRVGVINKPLLREFLQAAPDADTQPVPVGTPVQGMSNGNGNAMELYFYIMPQTRKPDPVYP